MPSIVRRYPRWCREIPQSGCPNRPERTSFLKTFQTLAPAEISNLSDAVKRIGAAGPAADEFLHRLFLFLSPAEVTFASGLPYQFGKGGVLTSGPGVKRIPEGIIQVKLRPPHDVCYTSRGHSLMTYGQWRKQRGATAYRSCWRSLDGSAPCVTIHLWQTRPIVSSSATAARTRTSSGNCTGA